MDNRTADRFKSPDLTYLPGLGRILALALICVVMSFAAPAFLTSRNLVLILTNTCINAILGVGLTITIITCGPDLSVGSILSITAVIATSMSKAGIPFYWAFLAAIVLGLCFGLLNGFLIAKIGIPSFISTYGLQWALFGFAYVILNGIVLYDFEPAYRFVGNASLLNVIPMPIVVMLVVVSLAHFMMTKTSMGRVFLATGANRDAAQMSGINTQKVILSAFAISGVLAAVAGIVLTARINACQADIGKELLLPSIATVYMGGTRATGGEGNVFGTLAGALIMTVVENSMNLLGVPSVWRSAIVGVIIIATVMVNLALSRRIEKIAG
jgi:ribose transport system permease protein